MVPLWLCYVTSLRHSLPHIDIASDEPGHGVHLVVLTAYAYQRVLCYWGYMVVCATICPVFAAVVGLSTSENMIIVTPHY